MGRVTTPKIASGVRLSRFVVAPAETLASGALAEPVQPASARTARTVWLADMLVPERNSFGVVRLILAMAVLVSHAVWLATGRHELEPLHAWTGYTLGQHGVQVFFFLSGILVAQSLVKSGSVRDYATARMLRIVPGLVVCVALTGLMVGPLVTSKGVAAYFADPATALYLVKTLSLSTGSATLPGVFDTLPAAGAINTSLWTLKYEVLCYAILALGGAVAIRTGAWRTVSIAGFAVWAVVVFYAPVGLDGASAPGGLGTLRYFLLFFGMGVLAYALRTIIPVRGAILAALALVFAVSIGSAAEELVAAITLGYGALWLGSFGFGALGRYTTANDYSYGTYIYSMPVTQVLLLLNPGIDVPTLILSATAVTLVLAFLSWELVERPALRLRRAINMLGTGAATAIAAPQPVQFSRGPLRHAA